MIYPYSIDVHTAFRLLACTHAGALLAFGMMAVIAPVFLPAGSTSIEARRPPWGWLGASAMVKALSVGVPIAVGMIERLLPMEMYRAMYVSLAGVAWILALEFGLRWLSPRSRAWRALSLLAFAGWTLPLGWRAWSIAALAVAWLAAIPAVVLIALAARRAVKRGELKRRNGVLGTSFAALAGLAALEAFGTAYSDWFQGWTANTATWFRSPALFVPVAAALSLVLLAAWSWWMIAQFVLASAQTRVSRVGIAAVIGPAFGILFVSGFFVYWLDTAGIRHNTAMRPLVYAAVKGIAARLEQILPEIAPRGVVEEHWAQPIEARLAHPGILNLLPGTEGFVVWALRGGEVVSLLKVPRNLPSIPPVPLSNPQVFAASRRDFPRYTGPFTPPAMLDQLGLHVLHSVPLGIRLPTGEPVWLGLRQNFKAWDGNKREIYVQGIFTLGLAGIVGGVFGIFVLRVRREQEIQLARDRAHAANEAKSEFIAFVSHELRTPLQSVIGYADILRRRPDHPAAREFLESLGAQGRSLLDLVNQLLDFSAAEAGRLTSKSIAFDLREVLDECARTVAPEVQTKRLDWEVSIDPAVPGRIQGDRERVRQVLLNVIGNAVKFTDQGGVTVRVTAAPCHASKPGDPAPGGGARHDPFPRAGYGSGPLRGRTRPLFEVFGRLRDKERGGKTGSGLGLALSRKLCGLMSGEITLANRDDGHTGAVANVILPFAPAVEPGDRGEESPPAIQDMNTSCPTPARQRVPRGTRSDALRVLVADDHPHVREVLCEMLASLGCAVETTDNGLAAAALACEGGFEVVLLDTWMPGMGGRQVAEEIRRACAAEFRPWIIGISASSRPEDRAACLAAGMDAFLAKPIDRGMLHDALQNSGPSRTEQDQPGLTRIGNQTGVERVWRPPHETSLVAQMAMEIESVEHANGAGDWPLVRRKSHYLENSAICLGWLDVAEYCARLGAAADRRDREVVRAALDHPPAPGGEPRPFRPAG